MDYVVEVAAARLLRNKTICSAHAREKGEEYQPVLGATRPRVGFATFQPILGATRPRVGFAMFQPVLWATRLASALPEIKR